MSRSEIVVIPGSDAATERYSGYSWTTLFFGPFPALFRGDLVGAVIGMIIGLLTLGLGWIVWAAFYNESQAKRLAERGYRPSSTGVAGSPSLT